jgi:iron-sulfur cluster assembly protein
MIGQASASVLKSSLLKRRESGIPIHQIRISLSGKWSPVTVYQLARFYPRLLLSAAEPYSRVMAATEVKYKIGNERLVKVTGSAAAKLSQLLQRQGRPQGALRVAVIGGGCSGLQYKMDLVDGPANRDIVVESNSVRIVVDPKSALFVSGSLLDYSDDLQKGGFKVTNPNAVAHCSCGESFSA